MKLILRGIATAILIAISVGLIFTTIDTTTAKQYTLESVRL